MSKTQLLEIINGKDKICQFKLFNDLSESSACKLSVTSELIDWIKEEIEKKNPFLTFYYGWLHRFGWGVERDFYKAFEYFKRSSEIEPGFGNLGLGHAYFWGIGVEINCDKAFENFKVAVEYGSVNALFYVSQIYFMSAKENIDIDRAMTYLNLAVEKGDEGSILCLADIYFYGFKTIEKNYEKAIELFKLVENDYAALIRLWKIYKYGLGTNIDYDKANIYKDKILANLNNGAAKGDIDAIRRLGYIYFYGEYEIEKDYVRAWEYLNSISTDISAKEHLIICYKMGLGTPKDNKRVLELTNEISDYYYDEIKIGNYFIKSKSSIVGVA